MSISEIRKKIDVVDDQILEMLERRAELALQIGEEKRRAKPRKPEGTAAGAPAFYDPARERQVLARLSLAGKGRFPARAIPFVFREVMSACRSLEANLRVAFLGPQGTYSQIASHQIFGHAVTFVPSPTIEAVFESLKRGEAEYGVVPFENSYEGCVPATLDAFLRFDVRIQSELYLRVNHCLVSKQKKIEKIRKVISHPQGLAQCKSWLRENLPSAELVTATSTAEAARKASKSADMAAISSRLAAEIFKLNLLKEGIQDQVGNATRFVVVVREDNENARPAPTGHDRTTLLLTADAPVAGADLIRILEALAQSRARVLRMESRASGQGRWGQAHFIDIQGHAQDPSVRQALATVESQNSAIRILGSYPAQDPLG